MHPSSLVSALAATGGNKPHMRAIEGGGGGAARGGASGPYGGGGRAGGRARPVASGKAKGKSKTRKKSQRAAEARGAKLSAFGKAQAKIKPKNTISKTFPVSPNSYYPSRK